MRFYLGSKATHWLRDGRFRDVPLFVSVRRFRLAVPRLGHGSVARYAVDSGGFTELSHFGRWQTSARDYATELRYLWDVVGPFDFAAPQDWMCEPFIVAKTGRSVEYHQSATVANYLELRPLAPRLPIIPVVQGFTEPEYLRCVELYARNGVDLTRVPLVGVGSVCRRQGTAAIAGVFRALKAEGLALHGFGVKTDGLRLYGDLLASSDSMAWSRGARFRPPLTGCRGHVECSNCAVYALQWYGRIKSAHVGRKKNSADRP